MFCINVKYPLPSGNNPIAVNNNNNNNNNNNYYYYYYYYKMEQTECSETSAYKIQTPGNYPEESIQHSEQDKSLKSRETKQPLLS